MRTKKERREPAARARTRLAEPCVLGLGTANGHRSATTARAGFAETVNRAIYAGERVIVRRHGKEVAAVVPIQDLQLLEAIEDRIDIDAAREALKEKGSVAWAKVKARLKL